MANGVAVVDTKNPCWGQPILDSIKKLTPKPVTMIINTHTHGDHVSGNVEFPATVDVVVQQNTAANMKKFTGRGSTPEKPVPSIFEQNQGRGMPKRTFRDRMTIGSGADQIDLHYFGRGQPTATPGSCFRRCASCTRATSSPGTTGCRCGCEQRRQRRRDSGHPDEGARGIEQERRHHHYRTQRPDDVQRSACVGGLEPGFPERGRRG